MKFDLEQHAKKCSTFYVQGRVSRLNVYGVCSRCGEVLERYERHLRVVKADNTNDERPSEASVLREATH